MTFGLVNAPFSNAFASTIFTSNWRFEFHVSTVQFLGYHISTDFVMMDQGKVDVVLKWSQPSTVRELQRFLGFAKFYSWFIAN